MSSGLQGGATSNADELSHLGEFAVIRRLTASLESRPDVLLGVGDDAALLELEPGNLLVATCDAQVEGKHFLRHLATYEEIGHKALAVNLSDMAAMGADPHWALVSLLLPNDLTLANVERVYLGMRGLAQQYNVAVVGGNVAATTGPFCIDITLLGSVTRERVIRRSGAQIGDAILVTGQLGAAAAGLLWATASPAVELASKVRSRTRQALVAPQPCVAEGQALAASGVVTAMLDISDGLTADLAHLCAASNLGAVLEAETLPIDTAAAAVAAAYTGDALALALAGGEDYVLLFTTAQNNVATALAAIAAAGGTGYVIGQMVEASDGLRLHRGGDQFEMLEPQGWDHLRTLH